MNAALISAMAEMSSSSLIDEQGFEYGFIVEFIGEDQRDCWEGFYRTLAEAKRAFARTELSTQYDRVSIYECEGRVDWSRFDDRIDTRWATLVDERTASTKEVVWNKAEYDLWAARAQEYASAYWQKLDWLNGRTPAPTWA